MPVAALRKYEFAPKDAAEKFPAPLLFFGWEDHLMLCAPFAVPFPPTLKFGDMCRGAFPGIFGAHPDFAKIDWDQAEWFKSGQLFRPSKSQAFAGPVARALRS